MSDSVTVRVTQGNLRGRQTATKSGGQLFSFLSVPYARPPIGPLRFKSPQTPESWNGIREAQEIAPVCVQEDILLGQITGQEDCLYLNIYTSQLPSDKSPPKAVMVWIHGGGFISGSGNPDFYGPDYLVDEGVVVVTINYRLGIFGFLSLDNEAAPGNMGLKDQVAALQWVKENIATFGGDPNNVTIFGESAGSASVYYLMLSPLSKGLFHKAIAQSGSVLNPWAFSLTNRARAFRLGEQLGCKTSDSTVLLSFLMNADASELVKLSSKFFPRSERMMGLKFPFLPTVEPQSKGAFLSEHPLQVLQKGGFHKVPLITGINSHEGLITLRDMDDKTWNTINSQLDTQLPETINVLKNSASTSAVISRIKEFYFKNKPISRGNLPQFVDFQSDLNFVEGIYATLKYITASSIAPVYLYKFNFDGEFGVVKQFVGINMKGACHGDELGYLFRNAILDHVEVETTSPEVKTSKRMVFLWTNFAKTGNPTPVRNENIPLFWQPCTARKLNCLIIDKEMSLNEFPEAQRMKIWEEKYKSNL